MKPLKTITAGLALLFLAAACNRTPEPAPGTGTLPPAPSDTPPPASEGNPATGYPIATAPGDPVPTDPPYPLAEEPTLDPGYPAPEDPGNGYPAPNEQDCTIASPDPQRQELIAADGTALVGNFYPPAGCSAPVVLLFHQFGSDKSSWTNLARWLQNRGDETAGTGSGVLAAPAEQLDWFPSLPEDLSFAVFALDFRDHGESQAITGSPDVAGFLLDAQAALDYVKTLPPVDPTRIITLGASIGADASVDVCLNLDGTTILEDQVDEGCIGALALSPGSFLEVPYAQAVTLLGEAAFSVNLVCVAAEQDGNAPELCQADVPGQHEAIVYAGRSEHGIALLAEGFDPDIGQVIHDFLLETLGVEG